MYILACLPSTDREGEMNSLPCDVMNIGYIHKHNNGVVNVLGVTMTERLDKKSLTFGLLHLAILDYKVTCIIIMVLVSSEY